MRRDCLKCAVLCYTLGRLKFERSTRHGMEFKIRIKSCNKKKVTFLNEIK